MSIIGTLQAAPIVIERTYPIRKDKVWQALTDLNQMKIWYFPELEAFRAEVGFETVFTLVHKGIAYIHCWKVTEVIPGCKISYAWRFGGYPGNSLLTIELFEQLGLTWLRLTHSGIESFQGDVHPDLRRENFIEGWNHYVGHALRAFLAKP